MLASSGVTFGFKKTVPHLLGVTAGFCLMIVLLGLGIAQTLANSPIIFESLKVISILYLSYLSYKIYCYKPTSTSSELASKPINFIEAALFQWINPKAWIMALGAIATYTQANSSVIFILFISFIYALVNFPCVGIWAYAGDRLRNYFNNWEKVQKFNTCMCVLLLTSIVLPSLQSIQFFIAILRSEFMN